MLTSQFYNSQRQDFILFPMISKFLFSLMFDRFNQIMYSNMWQSMTQNNLTVLNKRLHEISSISMPFLREATTIQEVREDTCVKLNSVGRGRLRQDPSRLVSICVLGFIVQSQLSSVSCLPQCVYGSSRRVAIKLSCHGTATRQREAKHI